MGDRRAREVLLLNRPITAQQALDWGWLNRVVPRAELDAAVDDYCDALLDKMPEITRATKVQLDYWKDLSWSMTIRMAREWLTVHAGSAEVAEGLASFEEKRPVDYRGLRQSMGSNAPGAAETEPSAGSQALSGPPPDTDDAPVTQEIHDA